MAIAPSTIWAILNQVGDFSRVTDICCERKQSII
jgi:hypothetical protein